MKPYFSYRADDCRDTDLLRAAKQAGVSDEERAKMVATIAADPERGDLIAGTGGARKVRFARPGSGKSGGYRIITYYAAPDVPVFLLDVYGKGDKANLSKSERNDLAAILMRVAAAYRAGAKAAAAAMQRQEVTK